MEAARLIFEIDSLLWKHLLFSLKKNRQRVGSHFSLDEEVIRHMLAMDNLPLQLADDTFLSFKLEQDELFFSRKLFPENDTSLLLKSSLSFVDISYWITLKEVARLDLDMAMVSFGLPRNVIEWTLSASLKELYNMAVDTTDSVLMRYPCSFIKELLEADRNDETVLCKKASLAVKRAR